MRPHRRRKICSVIPTILVLISLAACGGRAQEQVNIQQGRVLARLGGREITDDSLDARLSILEFVFGESPVNEDVRAEMLLQQIEQELLAREAMEQGIGAAEGEVEQQVTELLQHLAQQYGGAALRDQKMKELHLTETGLVQFFGNFMLAQKAREHFLASITLSDAELIKYYEENKTVLYTFTEEVVRAAHILLPAGDQNTAKSIADRARAGEDFAALAQEYSIDDVTAGNGGDLGYFRSGDKLELSEAAFALRPGEISHPVSTAFGWHVIKLLDRRPAGVIPFEIVKSDIQNRLLPRRLHDAMQGHIEDLKEHFKVEILYNLTD